MCTNDKGKQINKQRGVACVGVQMQGVVWLLCNLWSPLCNASEYAEGLQRCLEKCRVQYTRLYSDITPSKEVSPVLGDSWGTGQCHGTTSLPLLCPPLATSDPICPHSAPSTSTPLQL